MQPNNKVSIIIICVCSVKTRKKNVHNSTQKEQISRRGHSNSNASPLSLNFRSKFWSSVARTLRTDADCLGYISYEILGLFSMKGLLLLSSCFFYWVQSNIPKYSNIICLHNKSSKSLRVTHPLKMNRLLSTPGVGSQSAVLTAVAFSSLEQQANRNTVVSQ